MSVIGTLGRSIIFEVSDRDALLLQNMTRQVAGRWTTHTTLGTKPKSEFLGPDVLKVGFSIYLSANLGVRPRSVLESIAAMVETGRTEYLIIGNRPVSSLPFKLVNTSEAWDTIYNRGELAKATVSIQLEEYA